MMPFTDNCYIMCSPVKFMAYRKDEKEEKSLERAQKEAEMISEFAKDARNRKEAQKVANKLEATIEHRNEEKQEEKYLNIHNDLVTYKNKPFKLQEKLQITTLNLKKK